jgi:hypothetical protein
MKLFEDMREMGGTINDVIQQMINDVFNEEVDDDQIKEIVSNLSLSDILALDSAYTAGDHETIQDIIGPLPTMEYSMGGNHPTASAASARPAVQPAGGSAANKKPGGQNAGQSSSNYSGGVQNGVSTTNIDNEDDPEQMAQDEEPIEEAGAPDYNPARGGHDDYDLEQLAAEYHATMAGQGHRDEQDIIDDMYAIADPYEVDEIMNAMHDAGEPDYNPARGRYNNAMLQMSESDNNTSVTEKEPVAEEVNIVQMTEWLKRRAGIV